MVVRPRFRNSDSRATVPWFTRACHARDQFVYYCICVFFFSPLPQIASRLIGKRQSSFRWKRNRKKIRAVSHPHRGFRVAPRRTARGGREKRNGIRRRQGANAHILGVSFRLSIIMCQWHLHLRKNVLLSLTISISGFVPVIVISSFLVAFASVELSPSTLLPWRFSSELYFHEGFYLHSSTWNWGIDMYIFTHFININCPR